MCFFDNFLVRQKIYNKSPMSAALAANWILRAIFGRGRRERWGAREEKEEGLLRSVDCAFKN